MSPKPLFARTMIFFMALAALLCLNGASSVFAQPVDTVRVECPTNITSQIADGDSIAVRVFITNSQGLGGMSLGFSENSADLQFSSASAGPTLAGLGGSMLVQVSQAADGKILIGWLNFVPTNPFPVSYGATRDRHLVTLYLKKTVPATSLSAACVAIDTTFVSPAGYWEITYQANTVAAHPAYAACGGKEINILGGCDAVGNNPPNAICQPMTLAAGANCTAVADINNSSNDPDSGQTLTITQDPPGPYPLGETLVQLIVTDNGTPVMADTCSATVTVTDQTDPVITCPANITVSNDTGACGATVNFAATATDNCDSAVAITYSQDPGAVFPVGVTMVTATATDDAGNDIQCQFSVTVNDTENPVAVCPADINVTADPGETSAIVNFLVSATDNCPDATAAADPASGTAFPLGLTVVTVTATDAHGNTNQCQFNVTVSAGNAAPVVADIPDQVIDSGSVFADFDLDDYVTDADNTDDEITWSTQLMKAKGALTVSIDPLTHVATIIATPDFIGSAVFTFRATDPDGAFDEDQATFTVNSVDTNDPPVVSDIPDQTIVEGGSFSIIDLDDYVVDPDNADNEMTWTFTGNAQLSVSIDTGNIAIIAYQVGFLGSETVTFTATDPGALFDSDDATFTVNQELNPDFEVVATPEQLTVEGGIASPFLFDVAVNSIDGFTNNVTLSVAGLPVGATADFSVNSAPAPYSSVLSGAIAPETPAGNYQLVITGVQLTKAFAAHIDTVTLIVGGCVAPPVVGLSQDVFDVTAEEGSSPADELVYVTNAAVCGTLYWEVTSDQPWVSADPMSGSVDAGETPGDAVALQFNTASLTAAGSPYVAHVQVHPVVVGKEIGADENGVITITLTITEPPVSDDTVLVSHEMSFPGEPVGVELTFTNFEELAGMSAGLTWSSSDVMLDSVSFQGSRIDYIGTKITTINNGARTLALGVLRIPPEPLVSVGTGLWATLWFTVDGAAAAQVVTIDTVFIQPGVELLFNDLAANSIYPQFGAGSITIQDIAENCISGTILDSNGDPVDGATVELIDVLDDVIAATTSGIDGFYEFCFMVPPADGYTVRAYKGGFYPNSTDSVSLPDDNVDIVLDADAGEVMPTYEWVDLYCQGGALAFDAPVPVGSVLEAFDPDGVLCGRWVFTAPGTFGFMPVYVDDPYSPSVDEGCVIGDEITLMLNGGAVDLTGDSLVWTGNGDRYEACFTYPATGGDVTKCLHLATGWNLVSLNVALSTSELEVLFADVLDNTDVILSFESVGLTYDPDLPDFSTLFDVDNAHGYWFRMDSPDSICFTGALIAASTPISLENNWNLVSYLPENPLPVPDALVSIWSSVVVVLGYEGGGLSYDPALPELATLNEMKEGFGYWIKTNAAGTLIYPDGEFTPMVSDNTRTLASFVPRVRTSNTWINLYGSNVKLDGQTIPTGATIEAYDESGIMIGECTVRQSGKFGFMPVYGPDNFSSNNDAVANAGKISFKINGQEIEQTINWTANGDRVAVSEFTSVGKVGNVLPDQFSLAQNYPNPFNPETAIEYVVAKPGMVEVSIYNVMGAKVKTLVSDFQAAGSYSVKWYGNSDNGQQVASGVYFYKMTAGDYTEIKKMTLLK
ncbi:MAG: HYR domain-containing protein [Candidatus Zixiibacteriota bacterium]